MQHELVEALMVPGLDVELLERVRPPAWIRSAACAGSPLEFVPGQSTAAKWKEVPPELAEVCERCPVRQECLDEAMADPSSVGVWGGLTDRQRAELRRRAKAA